MAAMLSGRLHKLLTATTVKTSKSQIIFWFSLSLTFTLIYGVLALKQAFGSEYVVQDDARQHVFWMQRFLQADLFPGDLIANYFQSVAPAGYTTFYKLFASLGINPLLLSKILPVFLGLITTAYCFGVCIKLFPIPAAGFVASLLLNQSLWLKDDLVSATPRAFIYPIFLAFLYYLVRRSLVLVCVTIALLGLFYPQGIFNAAIVLILQLVRWDNGLKLSRDRRDYLFCAAGLAVTVLVLLPFALGTSEFAPTITAAEARRLPEFVPGGRSAFFSNDPWRYWLSGGRSGFLPSIQPSTLAVGFLLPVLLRYPSLFPLTQQINRKIAILPQMIVASVVMFLAAHALLFKLHLPGRYSGYSLRIVLSVAVGITLIVLWDALWRACSQRFLILTAVSLLGVALLLYPSFDKNFPNTKYKIGSFPTLYQFFQAQPKDSLIASLAEEANNLPTFTQRSILVGREYAIPYQLGYYLQFRQRTQELINAQYSLKLAAAQNLIQKYGIDFWLLDKAAFTPEYVANNSWLRQYQPATAEAIALLQQGKIPALSQVVERCQVFDRDSFVILKAECILNAK